MGSAAKYADTNNSELGPAANCLCPNDKCHHGRRLSKAEEVLCDKCIDLWFRTHLRHRIEKMLAQDGAESRCIAMRSLLQFLGLRSSLKTGTFELISPDYNNDEKLAKMRSPSKWHNGSKVTYEIRADNLGGQSFDGESLNRYKTHHPKKEKLLARFLQGVNVHTAHLTWGANHTDQGPIWDINDPKPNQDVVREICTLLQERVYKGGRKPPWDEEYRYMDDHDEDGLPTAESNTTSG